MILSNLLDSKDNPTTKSEPVITLSLNERMTLEEK
jgi:hypothetical protein